MSMSDSLVDTVSLKIVVHNISDTVINNNLGTTKRIKIYINQRDMASMVR